MKINDSHYISGMPANDYYKIELTNGLTLTLTPEEYKQLSTAIDAKNQSDVERIEKATKRYYERGEKIEAFVKDLRSLFYHGDEDRDILFRTELKEVDEDKLFNALENYKEILGLE